MEVREVHLQHIPLVYLVVVLGVGEGQGNNAEVHQLGNVDTGVELHQHSLEPQVHGTQSCVLT
jgi:hypothetical protein